MLPGDGHFSLGIFGQIGNLRQRPWAVDAKRAKAAIFRWASSVKLAIFGRDRGPSMRTSEGGRFSLGIFGQVGNLRLRRGAIDANERSRPFFVGHLRASWQSSAKTAGHRCERAKAAIFRWASSVKLAIFGKDRGSSMRTSEDGHFSWGIFGQVGHLRFAGIHRQIWI